MHRPFAKAAPLYKGIVPVYSMNTSRFTEIDQALTPSFPQLKLWRRRRTEVFFSPSLKSSEIKYERPIRLMP